MRVLLTDAFGNVGSGVRREIAGRGHQLRGFDLPSRNNRRAAKKSGLDVIWGDLGERTEVARAVSGVDVVIHLGAIIPPTSEREPALAERVNVAGTRNLIGACQEADHPVQIIFASSLALFGPTQHLPPPRTLDDPIVTTDRLHPPQGAL